MKKFIYCIILLFSICLSSNSQVKTLVNHNGIYKEFNQSDLITDFKPSNDYKVGSFMYYVEGLGYYRNEIVSIFGDNYEMIGINPFNNQIIFVIDKISKIDNNKYLKYTIDEDKFISNLNDGIINKSIRKDFIENSLGIKSINDEIIDNIHGFKYIFSNNILIKYISNDGLNKNAKYVKSNFINIYNQIFKNGNIYYKNEQLINFINKQCDYFVSINVNYLKQGSNSSFNYNYALLYASLYHKMSLDDFIFLVPNSEIKSNVNEYTIVSSGLFCFVFKNKMMFVNN